MSKFVARVLIDAVCVTIAVLGGFLLVWILTAK